MILAYRKKTGCKQYVFQTYEEMVKYFSKTVYLGETIYYYDYTEDDCLFQQGFFKVQMTNTRK